MFNNKSRSYSILQLVVLLSNNLEILTFVTQKRTFSYHRLKLCIYLLSLFPSNCYTVIVSKWLSIAKAVNAAITKLIG